MARTFQTSQILCENVLYVPMVRTESTRLPKATSSIHSNRMKFDPLITGLKADRQTVEGIVNARSDLQRCKDSRASWKFLVSSFSSSLLSFSPPHFYYLLLWKSEKFEIPV